MMIDLDQRLDDAVHGLKAASAAAPLPLFRTPASRRRVRPVLVAVAVALVASVPLFGVIRGGQTPDLGRAAATAPGMPPTVESVGYTIDGVGWEIVAVTVDEAEPPNRFVGLLDMSDGPGTGEGTLPTMRISTGLAAESVQSRADAGLDVPEWSFPVQGTDALMLSSGSNAGVVLWISPTGTPVLIEYDRLDHNEAEQLLATLRPITEEEWSILIDRTRGTSTDSPAPTISSGDDLIPAVVSDGEYDFSGIAADRLSQRAADVADVVVPNGQVIYYEAANPDLQGWHHELLSIATSKGSAGDVFTVWWQDYDPTWDVDRFLTDDATVETWPPQTRVITTNRQTNIQILMITDELIVSVIVEAAPKSDLFTDEQQLVEIARGVLWRISNDGGQ